MGGTIRFLGRYSAQTVGIFAAFCAASVAGCWFTGTRDGLFGTYVEVFFGFAAMFSALTGISMDAYVNVALSMGARRRNCFWAAELCGVLNVLLLVGLAAWMRWAVDPLPGDQWWRELAPAVWPLMIAEGLFLNQVGLLVARIESPRWRTAGIVAVTLLSVGSSVLLMLAAAQTAEPLLPAVLTKGLLAGLPAGALLVGAGAYFLHRKAVVRV